MSLHYLITPDRWLVTSPEVFRLLHSRWAPHVDSALMSLRLAHEPVDLVERVDPVLLEGRIRQLLDEGWRRVRVVFEHGGPSEVAALGKLDRAESRRLRLHVYHDDPMAVVDTLRAPEEAVLSAWQARKAAADEVFIDGPGIDDDWRRKYVAAFQAWEADGCQSDPERFAELYPDVAVQLGRGEPAPVVVLISPDPANDAVISAARHVGGRLRTRGRGGDTQGPLLQRLKWTDAARDLTIEMQPPSDTVSRMPIWLRSGRIDWTAVATVVLNLGSELQLDFDARSSAWHLMDDRSGILVETDRGSAIAARLAKGMPGIGVAIVPARQPAAADAQPLVPLVLYALPAVRAGPQAPAGHLPGPMLEMIGTMDDGAGFELQIQLASAPGRDSIVNLAVPSHLALTIRAVEIGVDPPQLEAILKLESFMQWRTERGISRTVAFPVTTLAALAALGGNLSDGVWMRLQCGRVGMQAAPPRA